MIVIGRTVQEHLHNLQKLFQRFREVHLKLNPGVCQRFPEGITLRGYYCVARTNNDRR
jgi:hypothetical protein